MELTIEYLKTRHEYWKQRIADRGIWNSNRFNDVKFEIKPFSKTYNALCIYNRNNIPDITLRFYWKDIEMSPATIDSVLVHEMIHQYIFQNDKYDSSVHGPVFKEYMTDINELFPDELDIEVSSYTGITSGPGKRIHRLILLRLNDDRCIWCITEPRKYYTMLERAAKNMELGIIKGFLGCESNDLFFNSQTYCRKRFRGVKMSIGELRDFCKQYNVKLSCASH